VDFVLSGPVPWAAADAGRAGTVHVGGTRPQMVAAEAAVARGQHAPAPVVLVSDPVVADPAREVGGLRPLWTYAHVPAGSTLDVTATVVAQLERFAPGFRDLIVASRCVPAAEMASHNANYIGGDIASGAVSMYRMIARPVPRLDPYSAGIPGVYLCSASTPPAPGVHGMKGWFAAGGALRSVFGIRRAPDLAP
jgi:phytoene dehydrogenase-like protein